MVMAIVRVLERSNYKRYWYIHPCLWVYLYLFVYRHLSTQQYLFIIYHRSINIHLLKNLFLRNCIMEFCSIWQVWKSQGKLAGWNFKRVHGEVLNLDSTELIRCLCCSSCSLEMSCSLENLSFCFKTFHWLDAAHHYYSG